MTTTQTKPALTDEEALAIFESGEGFDPVPGDYTPLGEVLLARRSLDLAEEQMTVAVKHARDSGLSWAQLAVGLGLTKEGARKRYAEQDRRWARDRDTDSLRAEYDAATRTISRS